MTYAFFFNSVSEVVAFFKLMADRQKTQGQCEQTDRWTDGQADMLMLIRCILAHQSPCCDLCLLDWGKST